MTRDLLFLGLLALGLLGWTLAAAEFAPLVKRAERRVLRLAFPAAGEHSAPEAPAHPRFGALLADTPPDGVAVLVQGRPANVGGDLPCVRADRPVTPAQTGDSAPWDTDTASFPALDPELERERRAWAKGELEGLGSDPTQTGVMRVLAGLRAMPHGTEAGQ